jgi:hypothetical protein
MASCSVAVCMCLLLLPAFEQAPLDCCSHLQHARIIRMVTRAWRLEDQSLQLCVLRHLAAMPIGPLPPTCTPRANTPCATCPPPPCCRWLAWARTMPPWCWLRMAACCWWAAVVGACGCCPGPRRCPLMRRRPLVSQWASSWQHALPAAAGQPQRPPAPWARTAWRAHHARGRPGGGPHCGIRAGMGSRGWG